MKAVNWIAPLLVGVSLMVSCTNERPKEPKYPDEVEEVQGESDLRSEYQDDETEELSDEGAELEDGRDR